MNTRHHFSPVIATALAATLSLGTVTPAFAVSAELEAQVSEAQARLSELYGEAEQRNYELEQTVGDLNSTIKKLNKTSKAITQTEADLAVARQHLSDTIAEDYKAGHVDLLTLVLGADDFEGLISRFVYANKVASYRAEVVAEVVDLTTELKEQKDTYTEEAKRQKKLVSEQKRLKKETDEAVAGAQEYYDQLSEELRAQIAAEQEAAAKAAREEAAAAAAEAERLAAQSAEEEAQVEDTPAETAEPTDDETATETPADEGTTKPKKRKKKTQATTTDTADADDETDDSETVQTGYEAPASVTPAATYSAAAMVSQAYKAIGSAYRYSGYVWTGNPATSAFTCSGLVDFALGRPTNSSWPTSLYAEVQGAGGIKNSISKLSYGDLVFTGSGGIGHVGIYVGNGCFLDSSWDGVGVRSINPSTFIGGGSIF